MGGVPAAPGEGQALARCLDRPGRTGALASIGKKAEAERYASKNDLRHYFASLLIASGADVKTVQARLRHASAKTTLDTYGHIWPDRDESTRAAVDAVITARTEQGRNSGDPIKQRRRSGPV